MVARDIPFTRVAVLKISAGMIQDIVPEAQKQKLNNQVLAAMKAQ